MCAIFPQLWTTRNHNRGKIGHYRGTMENEATLVLAENVRRLMAHRGMTLMGLAKLSKVSKSNLGYLVNYRDANDRHPTTKTIEGIAKAIGIPAWQLMVPGLDASRLQSRDLQVAVRRFAESGELQLSETSSDINCTLLAKSIETAMAAFRSRQLMPSEAHVAQLAAAIYQHGMGSKKFKVSATEVDTLLERMGRSQVTAGKE